jgi:hypothetical protein
MLTTSQITQYQEQGYLSYPIHGSEPNQTNTRRTAVTIRYVPATTRIQDQPDRRQFLVRGRAVANGNVYDTFGTLSP